MAWSASKIFPSAVYHILVKSATAIDMDADAFKAALYNDTITPNQLVTAANSAYGGGGVWVAGSGANIQDASGWPYVGRPLVSPAVTPTDGSSATIMWDAADTASANATTTLASIYGTLVYDDTATSQADQGMSYHYFGGVQSVSSGTFTIVWAATGLWSIAL